MMSANEVEALDSWYAPWGGIRVAVLGLGVTGFSVADTLMELGAEVLVVTEHADEPTAGVLEVIGAGLLVAQLDGAPQELVEFAPELVVVSPGFPPHHPVVRWAEAIGLPVWGDVELAWRLRDKVAGGAPWITVTGTNGKTTTVQLATAMLHAGGLRAAACGNVGIPVLDAIRDPTGFDVLVVELSSFQLHYVHRLSPHSSACLNLADDHLDWHGSAEAYRAAKAKVYENTHISCVYNTDDAATMRMVEEADVVEGCRAIGFGLGVPGPSELGVIEGIVVDRAFGEDRRNSAIEISTVDELREVGLGGPHMVANVLAATALARSFGVGMPAVRAALAAFRPDSHRTEHIANGGGIVWVNDSKATNPHAASASLRGYESVVWIVGGLFKGASVDELIAAVLPKLRAVVVIGAERQAVLAAFARHAPELPVIEVTTLDTNEVMPSAVRLAAGLARRGDVVLLAPAAASMDQFKDYSDRGTRFAVAVHDMLGDETDDSTPG